MPQNRHDLSNVIPALEGVGDLDDDFDDDLLGDDFDLDIGNLNLDGDLLNADINIIPKGANSGGQQQRMIHQIDNFTNKFASMAVGDAEMVQK